MNHHLNIAIKTVVNTGLDRSRRIGTWGMAAPPKAFRSHLTHSFWSSIWYPDLHWHIPWEHSTLCSLPGSALHSLLSPHGSNSFAVFQHVPSAICAPSSQIHTRATLSHVTKWWTTKHWPSSSHGSPSLFATNKQVILSKLGLYSLWHVQIPFLHLALRVIQPSLVRQGPPNTEVRMQSVPSCVGWWLGGQIQWLCWQKAFKLLDFIKQFSFTSQLPPIIAVL